jgi:hypothetical protein
MVIADNEAIDLANLYSIISAENIKLQRAMLKKNYTASTSKQEIITLSTAIFCLIFCPIK